MEELDLGCATGKEHNVEIIDVLEASSLEKDVIISIAGLKDGTLGVRIVIDDQYQDIKLTSKATGYLLAVMATYSTLNAINYLPQTSEIEFSCSDNLNAKVEEMRKNEGL